jgi:hypothetical protein
MNEVNVLGILAATAIGMVLGALWYSPLLFGNIWMKCLGKTPETLGSATLPMIGSVIASFLTAFGVALLLSLINVATLTAALSLGGILGLLIIFPAFLSDSLFSDWGTPLLFIQSGYRVVSVLLMSVALFYI